MTPFAEMMRLWIKFENYSMGQVAREIGISKSTLSRLCSGKRPDVKTLLKLIRYMFTIEWRIR